MARRNRDDLPLLADTIEDPDLIVLLTEWARSTTPLTAEEAPSVARALLLDHVALVDVQVTPATASEVAA